VFFTSSHNFDKLYITTVLVIIVPPLGPAY
jgi:hypothetical protein